MDKTQKALNDAISIINKKYGDNSLMLLTKDCKVDIETISTGLPSMDYILGGGIPKGRIVEIFGKEASGKTTMAYQMLARAQIEMPDKKVACIDVENAFDPNYAKAMGIDLNGLLLNQPSSGESALDIVEKLAQTNAVSVIAVDSVGQLTAQSALDKEIGGTANIGTTARLLSQNLPRLSSAVSKTGTVLIFINQVRMKIGEMWTHSLSSLLINSANGGIPINEIVNNKIEVYVYSYNEKNGKIEKKPIVNWFNIGKAKKPKDFIHIETNSINSYGLKWTALSRQ